MNRRACWLLAWLLTSASADAVTQSLPIPTTLNDEAVGELNTVVDGQHLLTVDISPILPRLQQMLSPQRYETLQTNASPVFSPEALGAVGIQTRFDYQNLKLLLTVPVEARRTQELNLVGSPNFHAAVVVQPSAFSAYMNVRGGTTYSEYSQSGSQGFSDPQFNLENVFNERGVVLQNETAINPTPGETWQKRDTRLVWDQPAIRLRWELGDLNYPVTSLQGFLPMAGLSLNKEDSLQPYRLTTPLGQSSFFLKQDSKVDVMVNGQTVRTMQMSAGPHEISNYPLVAGANNVVLRITDAVGRVEYINATLFYAPGLLKGGEREFNVAVGLPSTSDPNSHFYDYGGGPAASAFYNYGFSDNFTAGVNAQAIPDTQEGGGSASWSTLLGIFSVDSAFSEDQHVGFGESQRLQYEYYIPRHGRLADGVLTLFGQQQSPNFTLPNPFISPLSQEQMWSMTAAYSQRLNDNWNAGVSYTRQWEGGSTRQETYSLLTGYSWRGLRLNVTLERTLGSEQQNSWGVFFTLTFTLSASHSLFASYDSFSHSSRAEWQYTEPATIETIDATVGAQDTSGETTGYGNVRYTGRRVELGVSQEVFNNDNSLTAIQWGTALVYAGGTFAVSRPISDSFLLVESTGSLRDEGGVGVERQGQRFQGQEDWLGPAVLPQVTSYYPQHLLVEPLQPEADFDPQTGDLRLEPTYHSGARLQLGQAATAYITATLVWADGKVATLQAGTLKAGDGTTTEFISNREGLVFLHGLKAGTYEATVANHPETPFKIVIPATKEKNLNLGQIRVPITE